ncbi:MAG: ABC transporter permease subunit [Planctomycetota bacterium]
MIRRILQHPSMGSHFVRAATNRDYTLAIGVGLLYTVLVYSLNIVVDLAYTLLDPRIRLEDQ